MKQGLFLFLALMSFAAYSNELSITSVNQYTCKKSDSGVKNYFYYIERYAPQAVQFDGLFLCHDVSQYGRNDSALFPRLETRQAVFSFWDSHDNRFFDLDQNGKMDVVDKINELIVNYGGEPLLSSLFFKSQMPGPAENYVIAGNGPSFYGLGWLMKPFVRNMKSYCPAQGYYEEGSPLALAIRDMVGVETEGLYFGEHQSSQNDFVILRESDLKAVWFYVENGILKAPTDNNVRHKTVYFYYPLNKTTPFIKQPDQKLFRLRSTKELGINTSVTYPTHDRKIGCIPKL